MPQAADIIVKKNDGATNITYTSVSPASGSNPAVWKSQSVGTAMAHQPELRLVSKDANKGLKRNLHGTYKYPQISTNTTTGVTSVVSAVSASVDFNFDKTMAQSDLNEAAAQFGNLMAAALIQACLKAGYSAT